MSVTGSNTYGLRGPTGRCAASERPIEPGRAFVATLVESPGQEDLTRLDYSIEAWDAGSRPRAPARVFASWRATMPDAEHKPRTFIDDAGLVALFEQLGEGDSEDPRRVALRYIIGLILIRKRLVTYEGAVDGAMMLRYAPRARTMLGLDESAPPARVDDPRLDEPALEALTEEIGRVMLGDGDA